MTDVYTDLRMIYEKLGVRTCPHCGGMISSAECREETEKKGNDFYVYMYCSRCGRRMDKITRTFFSFNTKEGACPVCEGIGRIHSIKKERVTDETLSLEDGAVRFFEKQYGKYQCSILQKAFVHFGLDPDLSIPLQQFSREQKAILYEGADSSAVKELFPDREPPKSVSGGRFEGIYPILWRRLAEKNGSVEQNTEEMLNCIGNVKTGQVTYAVRDTKIDDKEIRQGNIMGIGDHGILAVGEGVEGITMETIDAMVDEDTEIISVYYGSEVSSEDAQRLGEKLEERYPDFDVEVNDGGQPIYYYVVSVE